MMHWMFGNYGMSYGPGMGLFMFFFWFLIILAIFMLIKALISSGKQESAPPGPAGDSAEEILKKRYAKGEISEEEFRRMMDNLR